MQITNTMARKRLLKNRHLETHVRIRPNGYVFYQHPLMDKPRSFKKDVDEANRIARIVNAELASQGGSAAEEILTPYPQSFSYVLDRFIGERVPALEWSEDYQKEQLRKIESMRSYGGSRSYQRTDVLFFTTMVNELFTGDSRRVAIFLLRLIDRFAIGTGLRKPPNICDGILMPSPAKRQRPRVKDYDDFLQIREQGQPWEQDIMDFALITLQPRQVICSLDIQKHIVGNRLRFQRGKTGVYIEVEIGESLAPLIARRKKEAMRHGTKRLFCRPPKRGGSPIIKPGYLTRAITKCVKASGLYSEDNHPTLHEFRSLGGRLYEERGYPRQLIQDLMGHKKPSTTEIYLDPDEPKYITAKADLRI